MKKKILFCATLDVHFKAFHLPYMEWFKKQDWEVHVAAYGDLDLPFVDIKYNLPISRTPFSLKNYKAFTQLKHIIDENNYKIIHCHTPVGGALARLAARDARIKGTKVIYTAHGFHFCYGAPLVNWILYYPIERFLANDTDCLVTINSEDYRRAVVNRFKADRIEHIHGVGVNADKFSPIDVKAKRLLRGSMGYGIKDFVIFYAAEFNKNKNQSFLIKSLSLIKEEVPNAKLLLAGTGPLLDDCKKLVVSLGIEEMVDFLGFRNDIEKILKIADIAVASSLREGLPVNIMEALSCQLPVIATDNRGHRELVYNNKNGWIIDPKNTKAFSEKMKLLAQDADLRSTLGENGRKLILKTYSSNRVLVETSRMYRLYMDELEDVTWAIH
jgi:glycosyltransferase EpsD